MTESPSALLERAAARLEELASAVEGGPWCQHEFAGEPILLSKPSADDKTTWRTVIGEGVHPAVIAWVEAVQPSVAAPLVELLRDAARRIEKHAPLSPNGSTFQRCALDMARAILGEHTEEPS